MIKGRFEIEPVRFRKPSLLYLWGEREVGVYPTGKIKRSIRKEIRSEQARRQYRERNRILRALGFNSYSEYLGSEMWAQVKQKVWREGAKCVVCAGVATELHHRRYCKCDLEGLVTKHIVPICRDCHQRIEFLGGQKIGPAQVRKREKVERRIIIRRKGSCCNENN